MEGTHAYLGREADQHPKRVASLLRLRKAVQCFTKDPRRAPCGPASWPGRALARGWWGWSLAKVTQIRIPKGQLLQQDFKHPLFRQIFPLCAGPPPLATVRRLRESAYVGSNRRRAARA